MEVSLRDSPRGLQCGTSGRQCENVFGGWPTGSAEPIGRSIARGDPVLVTGERALEHCAG
jgi:hypothetical protein